MTVTLTVGVSKDYATIQGAISAIPKTGNLNQKTYLKSVNI